MFKNSSNEIDHFTEFWNILVKNIMEELYPIGEKNPSIKPIDSPVNELVPSYGIHQDGLNYNFKHKKKNKDIQSHMQTKKSSEKD